MEWIILGVLYALSVVGFYRFVLDHEITSNPIQGADDLLALVCYPAALIYVGCRDAGREASAIVVAMWVKARGRLT